MRCFYCDGPATEIEYLNNNRIPLCHKASCQHEFQEDEHKQKRRDRAYDEWITRSEIGG